MIPHEIALCNTIMLCSHYFHNFACGRRLNSMFESRGMRGKFGHSYWLRTMIAHVSLSANIRFSDFHPSDSSFSCRYSRVCRIHSRAVHHLLRHHVSGFWNSINLSHVIIQVRFSGFFRRIGNASEMESGMPVKWMFCIILPSNSGI